MAKLEIGPGLSSALSDGFICAVFAFLIFTLGKCW